MVKSSSASEEVAVNQSQRLEEGVEGSPVGPLRNRPWMGVGVEEGGCPLPVDAEGSWLAAVALGQQVLGNSWQLREVVEEGGPGPEVEGGESQLIVGVEVVEEESQLMVEVGDFQSPEEREYNMIHHVQ